MKDPTPKTCSLYSGNLAEVPSSTTELRKLSVGQLGSILQSSFSGVGREYKVQRPSKVVPASPRRVQ